MSIPNPTGTREATKGNFDDMKADSDAKEIGIFCEEKLCEINIAFDHDKIIKDCLKMAKNAF